MSRPRKNTGGKFINQQCFKLPDSDYFFVKQGVIIQRAPPYPSQSAME
jgi:hypothetical protein